MILARITIRPFSAVVDILTYDSFRYVVTHKKVFIERNNLQLELIRYRKTVDFIPVYFCEATDSLTERIAGSFEYKPLRLRF